ncbi:MAG: DUF4445 domain-containing protein [Lachnospiraceae bacterium]|nr:DUF4445 domain-containing protein [Lachnospiraceae bacterium]
MSASINITIIIEDGQKSPREAKMTHNKNMTLMSTLLKEGLMSVDNCGGRGTCGRCRIRFLTYAPIPTGIERNTFNPEELRQGYRLACMAKPQSDCVIRLEFINNREIDIVTNVTDIAVDPNGQSEFLNQSISQNKSKSQIRPIYQNNHIIAVDLGTTTIAMQLVELGTGKVIDTYCAMNPQRVYGSDVLSRIQAANSGQADSMKESVRKVISDGVGAFLNISNNNTSNRNIANHNTVNNNPQINIDCICIAGNTTMEHILMGLSTEGLGQSPFTPVELGLQKCTMPGCGSVVYITPGISTFVGGDIVAGLYHCNLLPSLTEEVSEFSKETGAQLFIDLGTNGEMAIKSGNRVIVTATAAGPAFEGGAGAAVPGSDMIKITASLLEQGIIDETGLLTEPYFENGVDITIPSISDATQSDSNSIHLTQSDIRALQMAKAAVRAGIDILCQKAGNPKIDNVYLAGGFGYYLDVNAAVTIGLLPANLRDCTQAAGNTSLAGAYDIGRDILTKIVNKHALENRIQQIESINLAQEDDFDRLYISYLNFDNGRNT